MTEGTATLFEIAVVLVSIGLGIFGHRLRRRIPWLNKPAARRDPLLFVTGATREEALANARSAQRSMQHAMQANAPALQRPVQDARAWLADAQPQMQSIKLSTLVDADNVLVAGPKGSGKTTLLRTIVNARASEQCIALDPHASPSKWPCMCIGGGLEWGDISAALLKMQRDMQSRFKQLAAGDVREGEFERRSYVGDEFLSIVQELDGKGSTAHAGKLLISRLTQGRKVGEAVLIASQNDTVEALGIQGNADLKGCFDYILFLGSLVSTRAKYHGCPPEIIAAAIDTKRPAVVWHPERNNWYVLVFDLEPVRERQMLSVFTASAAGTPVLVRGEDAQMAGTELPYQYGTGTVPANTDDEVLDEKIKLLHSAGVSWNKIGETLQLRGQKQQRNARIRQALGLPNPVDAEFVESE